MSTSLSSSSLWIGITLALEAWRCWHSTKFYQDIDWPCYSADGERLLKGDFDYQNYLCEWGYMYYPAGFAYFYAAVQYISGGQLDVVMWLHILVFITTTYLTLKLFEPYTELNPQDRIIYMLLPLIAQNIYRAGISRVTNDLHLTLCIVLMLHAILKKKYFFSSLLFSLAVSYKMNSLFYGPSLLFTYLQVMPFKNVILHFFFMGIFQLVFPLPFLLAAPKSYITLAFNFGRTFEHRLNLAWGFLGDELRDNPYFLTFLLFCTIFFLIVFYVLMYRNIQSDQKVFPSDSSPWTAFLNKDEKILFTSLATHFVCYVFSRGIHIQFFLWVSYSLPYLLTRGCALGWKTALVLYALLDWSHSWVANVIQVGYLWDAFLLLIQGQPTASLHVVTSKVFTQLSSIPVEEALKMPHVVKLLGAYYPYGYSWTVIPASFVLFTIELYMIYRLLKRAYRNIYPE